MSDEIPSEPYNLKLEILQAFERMTRLHEQLNVALDTANQVHDEVVERSDELTKGGIALVRACHEREFCAPCSQD